MLKRWLLPFTLILFPLFIPLSAKNIQFQGEQIEITVEENQVQVTGTYYLYNHAPYSLPSTLYYPFVVDDRLEYPDSINVTISANNRELAYRPESSGIFFSIPFLPEQSITLTVFYSQRTRTNQFEYILTSTKEWNWPLQFASYILKIPKDKRLIYLSLDYQTMTEQENTQVYSVLRSDFMPQENLKIIWKGKKDETF
jgi:hypothetical protein